MKQEDKELLLRDLSTRLPYGVKIHIDSPKYDKLIGTLDAVYPTEERVIVDNLDKAIAPINVRCGGFKIEDNEVKPYLRPMSSMTEEEIREFTSLIFISDSTSYGYLKECVLFAIYSAKALDWLNAHHFDYRGLIEKGLALEAPEGMY